MNKFQVTFSENKKYNPATRTVSVETMSAPQALFLAQQHFGKKKVNIISVVDRNGVDFLKPITPTEDNQDTINVSVDTEDVKVKFIPNDDVSEGNLTVTNSDNVTIVSDGISPDVILDGFSQVADEEKI